MKTVVIATNNANKVAEITSALDFEGWEFKTLAEMGVTSDPVEDGGSFEANARIKAVAAQEAVFAATGRLVAALADDSGLVVDALDGAPGVYSSRYAGTDGDDEANNAKLLYEMRHVPPDARTGRFVCTLVFIDEMGTECVAEGTVEGKIAYREAGEEGFGYDPLFIADVFGGERTLAQVSRDEKNAVSHRGNALRALHTALTAPENHVMFSAYDEAATYPASQPEAQLAGEAAPAVDPTAAAAGVAADMGVAAAAITATAAGAAVQSTGAAALTTGVAAAGAQDGFDRGYFSFGADGATFTLTEPSAQTSAPRYHRFALFADPALGVGGFSFRVRRALESLGHTVYWFTPSAQPWMFYDGAVRTDLLGKFVAGGHVDALMVADGLRFWDADSVCAIPVDPRFAQAQPRLLALVEKPADVRADYAGYDAALTADDKAARALLEVCPLLACVGIPACKDDLFASMPLANETVYGPGVLCLQDATPARIERVTQYLEEQGGAYALPVRCFGAGWPEDWSVPVTYAEFAYGAKSHPELLLFVDNAQTDDVLMTSQALSAVLSCGASPHLCAIEENPQSGVLTALQGLTSAAGSIDELPSIETALAAALMNLTEELAVRRVPLGGTNDPRETATVLGRFGYADFDEELLLESVDARIRTARPAASLVAVGANPAHTFTYRGVYTISPEDETALDEALQASSAALVLSDVLSDGGLCWSSGLADVVSAEAGCSLTSAAAYLVSAHLNGAAPVFYGVDAGPLEMPEARRIVKFLGEMGAAFLTRDDADAERVIACGANADLVFSQADALLLAQLAPSQRFDVWLAQTGLEDRRIIAVALRRPQGRDLDSATRIAGGLKAALASAEDTCLVFCIIDPEDRMYADEVVRALGANERVYVLEPEDSLEMTSALLNRAAAGFSTDSRIAAMLSAAGKPCVGMGEGDSFSSLYRELGCTPLLAAPDASADDIAEAFSLLLGNYSNWANLLTAQGARLRSGAERAELILLSVIDAVAPEKAFHLPRSLFVTPLTSARGAIVRARYEVAAERAAREQMERERDEARKELQDLIELNAEKSEGSKSGLTGRLKSALKQNDE